VSHGKPVTRDLMQVAALGNVGGKRVVAVGIRDLLQLEDFP
jgi:hypothetical protein